MQVAGGHRVVKRVGIFGGTFDPPHIGHLIVADQVLDQLGLDEVRLVVGGVVLDARGVERSLAADPEYLDVNALIERLPDEVGHRHDDVRVFADPALPEFRADELGARMTEIAERVDALRQRHAAGHVSFVEPKLALPLDRVFAPDDPIGSTTALVFEVDYRSASGEARTASVAGLSRTGST